MSKYPLDQEGFLGALSTLVEHNKSQEELIVKLSALLRETTAYVDSDNPVLRKQADELVQLLHKRKIDFANLRFDQKNGHKMETASPYEDTNQRNPAIVSNLGIEQEVLLNNAEESFGEMWTEEELAAHFGEKLPPKQKPAKEVSSMAPEEIREWERQQENSNDIYKLSARIKNFARQGGLASLTPVGESLCNMYTHVLKAFYDFAESLPDKETKIKLVELTRTHEKMPGDFISAMHANVKP